jgi:triacylglycerol lipase
MKILIGCMFAGVIGFSLLTFAFFWYETANSSHRSYLQRLSKGKVTRWVLKGILLGCLSQIIVIFSFPLGFRRSLRDPAPDPECPLPPVFLVHGLYHNPSAWIAYRWWLKRAGFGNVFVWSYSSWKVSFNELADQLEHWVNQVMTEHFSGRKAILIGHSLGGLLIRSCAARPGMAQTLAGIITLGAPHQGSKLAVLGIGSLARSLRYQGPVIQVLQQQSIPSTVPCVAIYSPIDNMVLPAEALHIDQAGWIEHETFPVSHIMTLYHRPTSKLVLHYLHRFCG